MSEFYDFALAPFVDFGFMGRGLVGCFAIVLGGAPLGVFLVQRRMSLVGDAMSHAILPGVAIAYLIGGFSLFWMMVGGLTAGLVVALLAGAMTRLTTMREDASITSFYLMSLSLGVLLVSLYGSNVDVLHVLFGTVLALDDTSLLTMAGISTFTVFSLSLLYRALVIESFDPSFLKRQGWVAPIAHFSFLTLVVLNLVGGFQALGTLMCVGLMMLPAVSARFWAKTLGGQICLALAIGFAASGNGLLVSFHAGLPPGPAIILSASAIFIGSLVLGSEGIVPRLRADRRGLAPTQQLPSDARDIGRR